MDDTTPPGLAATFWVDDSAGVAATYGVDGTTGVADATYRVDDTPGAAAATSRWWVDDTPSGVDGPATSRLDGIAGRPASSGGVGLQPVDASSAHWISGMRIK